MIDMHIHSTNSDGTKNVAEILKEAESIGLNTISFTDHENCNSYFGLGKIIPGIELKSQYKDITMDILGYGIDYKKMRDAITECYSNLSRGDIQEKQLKSFYEVGKRLDLKLRPIEELKWDRLRDWGSCVFYDEMKSHEENRNKVSENIWSEFIEFKRNYHSKTGDFYINRANYYPAIKKIIDIIHETGGKAFIAHIYEYKEIENKVQELEEIISSYDIDGIECYYTNFTEEEHKEVIELTKKHNLLISGGSDYHGDNKPGIYLGIGKGKLRVPDEIIENWNVNYFD